MTQVKQYRSLFILVKRLGDILFPALFLYLSALIYGIQWNDSYALLGLLAGLAFTLSNQFYGTYDNWRGRAITESIALVFKSWSSTLLLLMLIGFMLKRTEDYSRITIVLWSVMTFLSMSAIRYLTRQLLRYSFRQGWATKNIAIAGGGTVGRHLVRLFRNNPCFGYNITGIYDDDPALHGTQIEGLPVIGDLKQACKEAQQGTYEELYLCLPLKAEKNMAQLLEQLSQTTMVVKYVPDIFAFDLLHAKIIDLKGLPVISVYDSPMNSPMFRIVKRVEDIILSSLILCIIWPVMLLLAIGVKLSSQGPVFYRQTRAGWNGKPFTILKFRSMPIDLEKNSIVWGNASQKTNTKFGQFIRKTSLDELPQFLNVLFGHMSIVGPRPERDIFIEKIKQEVPRYMQRHMVKAGITGWAQINGLRGDTSLHKRVEFDLYYITHWSFWFDMKIIFRTAFKGWVADAVVPSVDQV